MPLQVQRTVLAQQFTTFAFTVPTVAAPLAPSVPINALVDTFIITVPATAANSVFLGSDAGVTITTGLELLAGTTVQFKIDHDGRQLYELQGPLKEVRDAVKCKDSIADDIPFVVWDVSLSVYLVAAANTTITAALFKAMYL